MTPPDLSPAQLEVLRALRDLRYGSVEVTVHDGAVVQIERREKLRPARPREATSPTSQPGSDRTTGGPRGTRSTG